jgi:3-oxoacyl-[acyl-carrier protein] reductase
VRERWREPVRNVIVTGGSRGLGLGISKTLCTAGYRVIAVARMKTQALDAVIDEAPDRLYFKPCDLTDTAKIPNFVSGLRKEFGPIYGLVNNAGLGTSGVLATMPDAKIKDLIVLNTLSVIMITKYVVRSMMAHGGGRIVNIASIVGSTGYSGLAAYSATKASLLGFTRSLAREVGGLAITVNAVAPGFIDTEMTHSLDSAQRGRIARRSALHRLAEIDDVANAVEFLIGENARNITGIVLTVDAGNTA